MQVKNLLYFPVQLGDGQMIGAAGTNSDTRDYGKNGLTERDHKRVKDGKLEVIKELPAEVETTIKKTKAEENLSDGENKIGGKNQ